MDEMFLETERLALRPLHPDHIPDLHNIFRDEETMRFMPSVPHAALEETTQQLAREMAHDGAHHWTIFLQGSTRSIGIVNYLGGTRVPGMGYIIHREYWGQGIAAEACRAALAFGFDRLGYNRVELWIDETNFASQRVAQKLNFRLKGRTPMKYSHRVREHMMLVFGLWAHEWRWGDAPEIDPRFYRTEPVLLVHDVLETANFYRDKLGFHIDFLYGDPPNHAGVSRLDWTGSGVVLQLSKVTEGHPIEPSSYLYIFVGSNIEALRDQFKANNAIIKTDLETYPWGMREFTIEDNNGHLLRFGTHT